MASGSEDPSPERRLLPYEATRLAARRVLVVAPHADDETFGCGGTLASLLADGARLDVLVVTDGAADEPDPKRRHATGELRLAETREALVRLGGGAARCAFLPDRGLASRGGDLRELLEGALLEGLPDLVFVPSPAEVHPDHRAVAEAFLSLWAGEAGRRLALALPGGARAAFYEVSHPIRPTVLVDVSATVARKEKAVEAFVSQLGGHDYPALMRALGAYRRMSLPRSVVSAEAFFLVPVGDLPGIDPVRLARAIGPTLSPDEVLRAPAPAAGARPAPAASGGAPVATPLEAPAVSVVVRTKDRPGLLREALASVAAQEAPALEVVVVNDGGADVEGIVDPFRSRIAVRLVDLQPGRGRSAAANEGIAAARGAWVHFLDDDDLLLPGGLAALVAEARPDEVVYGRVEASRYLREGEGRTRTPFRSFAEPFSSEGLLLENFIPLNAALFPLEALRRAGGMDPGLERFEDWDLFLRLSDELPFRLVDVPVAEYRLFPGSFIDDPDGAAAQHRHRVAVLEKHAHRYGPETLARLLAHVKGVYLPREVRVEAERASGTVEGIRSAVERTAAEGREAELASVVIVNFNGRHHLEKCLPSLEACPPSAGEVILVDNGSSDDSVAWTRANHPSVTIVETGANLGFGGANRVGIERAKGAFVVLLNSDTVVEPGWLPALLRPLREEGDVAATCSTLRLLALPELLNGEGGGMTRLGYAWDHRFRFPFVPYGPGDPRPRCEEVLFPTAAAMAMRKADFLSLGGFDPAFFMYHEDVDLGWRLWLLGKRVVVCRDSVVRHAFLGTSRKEKGLEWRAKLGLRHCIRSALKHEEPLELAKVLRWHVQTLARAGAWRLLAHAALWNLGRLPGTLRERRALARRRVRSPRELRARGLVSPALYPAAPPEPPRYRGGEPPETWLPSPLLLPGEFSGESRLGWGWYGRDDDGAGPFRWTAGRARCVLRVGPSRSGLLRCEVKLSCARPAGEVRLTCGGREAVQAIEGEAWTTVEIGAASGEDGLLDLRIDSPAGVPHGAIGNWDFRHLGAAVRSIRFVDGPGPAEKEAPGKVPSRVSVVIPTFNRWEVLRETLDALRAQTHRDLEVVVVDDGSTDGTTERLLEYRDAHPELSLLPLHQTNQKQGKARNLGVTRATGDLVLFLGDDTIPDPRCVEEHVAAHRQEGAPCAVIGFTDWHRERMRVTPFLEFVNGRGAQFSFDLLADGREAPFTNLYTSNVSLPRDVAAANPFDGAFTSYGWEDIELGYRLSRQGIPIVYRKAASTRHVHPQTLGGFLRRQRHVGGAIGVLYRLQPELAGNPFLPSESPRWRFRKLGPLYSALGPVAAACDRAGIPLPGRLYDDLLNHAFYQGARRAPA